MSLIKFDLPLTPANGSKDFSSNPKDEIIFPNQVHDTLLLSENILNLYIGYTIYDSNGKLVLSQKLNSNTLDMSFLTTGRYFVKFLNEEKVSDSFKVIKN